GESMVRFVLDSEIFSQLVIGGGDGALQRKEEDTVSVRRRMTLPLNEQTQLGTCETVRWNRSFKVVEALVYVNGFADYCFP
ncbi:hypothetical protein, partial [Bilophila wadsworthia]|uniref:hypothetical protein n=1 Tax=Bilophila wadsworthia TaxID=35833 RepID=UPI001EDB41FD